MALRIGDRLGHYHIQSALGAGGMGEVYRGRDTRLNRDVAIKIIPDELAEDSERLARFTREAQTLAALSHPHIAHVYGLEESGGSHAIVMELIEGEDLARRIGRGRLPARDAMRIGQQIAEALEIAHEKGIVHRDLKPSNVMIDADGHVKVLDFGLATEPEGPPSTESASAATMTSPAKLTGCGVIVGTPAYMSPEQVTGQSADKRCDVWAFGCVLFELLTGRRAFDGTETHDVMMAIASKEPDWSRLPQDTPTNVVTLVKRCLDKNRKRRLSDMSAARLDLEDALQPHSAVASTMDTPARSPSMTSWPVLALVLVVAAAAAGWLASRAVRDAEAERPMIRVGADVGAPVSLSTTQGVAAVLSPDGRILVFAGQPRGDNTVPRLYSRSLDDLSATPIPGTEGAINPFFSPDGQSLGFFAGGKLKKIALSSGAAVELADTPNGRGGSWGDDDHIVYMPDFPGGLWRVPASGGEPKQLTKPVTQNGTHRWPQVLPGSKAVIYTSNSQITGYQNAEIALQPLPSGTPRVIQKNATHGQFVASGHVIYLHQGALFAARFNLDTLERTTEPVPVIDDVAGGPMWTGVSQFAASNTGTAAYVSGKHLATAISIVDDAGAVSTLRADVTNWSGPSFSNDGRRLAADIFDGRQSDIWIHDLTDGSLSRLTHDQRIEAKPIWSPDGTRIVFGSVGDDGVYSIAWRQADGSGDTNIIWSPPNHVIASSMHPSGRFLAFMELDSKTSFDAKILPLEDDGAGGWKGGAPIPLSVTNAVELEPMFSPDGRWIAYSSTESGRAEVYVRPFPGLNGKWQVSAGGGTYPTWSHSKSELLYATLDQRVMSVSYSTAGNSFRASPPRVWTNRRHRILGTTIVRSFALHPDGKRLVLARAADASETASEPVVMVFNFFDELRRRVSPR